MPSPIPAHLEAAYQHCRQLAFSHYENFPVASLLLPPESRPHVAALYAFARTADDFADEPPTFFLNQKGGALSPEAKELAKGDGKKIKKWRLQQINRWEKELKAAMKGKPARPELRAFAHTLKTFQIPLRLPLDLLRAFRMDVANHRYSTWNALLYYCRHSANPVGRMVLTISGIREERIHRYSDFICSGLQLINFWQDSSVDLKRGRIYYPLAELKKAKVGEKDLLDFKDSPPVRRLVRNAVDFTESYFKKGFPIVDSVGGRLRWELKATCRGGSGILRKIRKMDYNVLQKRPTLGAWDKATLILKTIL